MITPTCGSAWVICREASPGSRGLNPGRPDVLEDQTGLRPRHLRLGDQVVEDEVPERLRVGDRDMQQVVDLAGDVVDGEHSGQRRR